MVAKRATDPRVAASRLLGLTLALGAQAEHERRAIRANTALSCLIVGAAIAVGYSSARASQYAFFAVVPLFVQQIFASVHHARRITLESAARSARYGLRPPRIPGRWLDGAALAIRESYLVLFAGFDSAWLFQAYVLPSPAATWHAYLVRLTIGPLPGLGLVLFTIAFWFVYPLLFLYGKFLDSTGAAGAVSAVPARTLSASAASSRDILRVALSARVTTREGEVIRLNGYRLPRPGARALILWPGFFQSAVVYDLPAEPETLAEHLHQRGFDLWLFHPRGTGGSEGARLRSSLDDYSASDLPAIIAFVSAKVSLPPLLVGHSQGGITAIVSLLGASFRHDGSVTLSDADARRRQSALGGLVTLGAFPSFISEHETALQRFVREGISLSFGRRVIKIPLAPLIRLVRTLPFVPVPPDVRWRQALLASRALRLMLFPLYWLLLFAGRLQAWEFLYHLPNVSRKARERLFLLTIEGTFSDILEQFYQTVLAGQMRSLDGSVVYSAEYQRLSLPVALVSMELDGFVDEPSLVKWMFDVIPSQLKQHVHIPGVGHEDFFMNPRYHARVSAAIEQLAHDVSELAPDPSGSSAMAEGA